MSFLGRIFKSKKKPRTVLDELHSILVRAFRNYGKSTGRAPSSKTSDEKIIEIYSKVATAFKNASEERGEFVSAEILNLIAIGIFGVYEMMGEEMMNEHLDYEVERYKSSGLRDEYKKGLKLF
jgi:hypothetical protein